MTEEKILQSVYVQLNCTAIGAGYYIHGLRGINNLFTAHEGCNVLRCNCSGMNANGPALADVNGCRSVNIDCSIFQSEDYIESPSLYHFNNSQSQHNGYTSLKNCYGRAVSKSSNFVLLFSDTDIEISGGNLLDDISGISGELAIK